MAKHGMGYVRIGHPRANGTHETQIRHFRCQRLVTYNSKRQNTHERAARLDSEYEKQDSESEDERKKERREEE